MKEEERMFDVPGGEVGETWTDLVGRGRVDPSVEMGYDPSDVSGSGVSFGAVRSDLLGETVIDPPDKEGSMVEGRVAPFDVAEDEAYQRGGRISCQETLDQTS